MRSADYYIRCSECGATPSERAIHRTSPKGTLFEGKCSECLGESRFSETPGDRLLDALTPIQRQPED